MIQLRPAQTSIVLFTAKGWDALSDPIIGYLASKTNTRFGKLRPWYDNNNIVNQNIITITFNNNYLQDTFFSPFCSTFLYDDLVRARYRKNL